MLEYFILFLIALLFRTANIRTRREIRQNDSIWVTYFTIFSFDFTLSVTFSYFDRAVLAAENARYAQIRSDQARQERRERNRQQQSAWREVPSSQEWPPVLQPRPDRHPDTGRPIFLRDPSRDPYLETGSQNNENQENIPPARLPRLGTPLPPPRYASTDPTRAVPPPARGRDTPVPFRTQEGYALSQEEIQAQNDQDAVTASRIIIDQEIEEEADRRLTQHNTGINLQERVDSQLEHIIHLCNRLGESLNRLRRFVNDTPVPTIIENTASSSDEEEASEENEEDEVLEITDPGFGTEFGNPRIDYTSDGGH